MKALTAHTFLSALFSIQALVGGLLLTGIPESASAQPMVRQIPLNGMEEILFVGPEVPSVHLLIPAPKGVASEISFSVTGTDGIAGTVHVLQSNVSTSSLQRTALDLKKWKKVKFANSLNNSISSFIVGSAAGASDPCSLIPDSDLFYDMYLQYRFAGMGFPNGYTKTEFCQAWNYANNIGGGIGGGAGAGSYSVGVLPDLCASSKTTNAVLLRLTFNGVAANLRQFGLTIRVSASNEQFDGGKRASLKAKSDVTGKYRGRAIFLFETLGSVVTTPPRLLMRICKSNKTCSDTQIAINLADNVQSNGQDLHRTAVPSKFFSVSRGEASKASIYLLKGDPSAKIAAYGHCFKRKRVRQNVGGFIPPVSDNH